jgi:nucleoside phosphorylase
VLIPSSASLIAQDLATKRARSRKDPVENTKRINTNIRGLRKYKNPGSAQDHLYRSDYIHLGADVSCDECGCDLGQRVQRAIDTEDDDLYVVVHRGIIAFGEVVIKNGLLRDQLAEKYGVLCFEIGAAGALVDFPCIVIRGISDYCDSLRMINGTDMQRRRQRHMQESFSSICQSTK